MNPSTLYYSLLALCGLLGELTTVFILQAVAWLAAFGLVAGRSYIDELFFVDR
ncbi:MAG: hypothetical protein WC216_02990 [Gallionella sp.]|jgi:hypothetical protein